MTESVIREPEAEWLVPQDANRIVAGLSAPLLQQRGETIELLKANRRGASPACHSRSGVRIADRFRPERIILFGSYAYGHLKPESDVDLLVIMDTPLRSRQQRLEISRALSPRPFPPHDRSHTAGIGRAYRDGRSVPTRITTRGKVLYERNRS